jgi:hypothetical protein
VAQQASIYKAGAPITVLRRSPQNEIAPPARVQPRHMQRGAPLIVRGFWLSYHPKVEISTTQGDSLNPNMPEPQVTSLKVSRDQTRPAIQK